MKLAAASGGKMPEFTEATEDDLAWVIDQFAQAAARVRQSGADAVELHGAHGYLLSTFLSRADNHRTDRWGGSIENRARLIVETTSAVRAAVGDDMVVIARISGREFGGPDAFSTNEAAAAAPLIAAAGADAIHITGSGRNSFANFTDGPLPDTIGAYREITATIKKAVADPVIGVGRITPEVAEEMLAAGDCDFVSMGRQLLADPDLVDKLRANRRASIRSCINCYVCVEKNFFDETPVCAVNPRTRPPGTTPSHTDRSPRHVVVVGGDPAGMEVACVARERRHRVTLLEAGDRLGGTAWFSQMTTPANGPLVEWLTGELDRLGVFVQCGVRAGRQNVAALHPDAVVIATGARRDLPDAPGAELDHVVTGDDPRALMVGDPAPGQPSWLRGLLSVGEALHLTTDVGRVRWLSRRWMPIGDDVVVIGGGLVGVELSEFPAERGRRVTLLEAGGQLGLPMALPRRWTTVRRACEHGVVLVRYASVVEITEHDVAYRVGDETTRVAANDVVVASGVHAGSALVDERAGLDAEVHVIGDAADIGYIEGAIHSAWSVAEAL